MLVLRAEIATIFQPGKGSKFPGQKYTKFAKAILQSHHQRKSQRLFSDMEKDHIEKCGLCEI